MHRRLILLGLVMCLCLLAAPSVASARWWSIKDSHGQVAAYAKVWSAGRGVANPTRWQGAWEGYNVHVVRKSSRKWNAWMGATGLLNVDVVHTRSGRWVVRSHSTGQLCGRMTRRSGRWIIQWANNGSWQEMGSVNDGCPAWLACGGTYASGLMY
ncbi:MAG: hypothetical protein WCN81_15175 [Actinomycetes bacterium]